MCKGPAGHATAGVCLLGGVPMQGARCRTPREGLTTTCSSVPGSCMHVQIDKGMPTCARRYSMREDTAVVCVRRSSFSASLSFQGEPYLQQLQSQAPQVVLQAGSQRSASSVLRLQRAGINAAGVRSRGTHADSKVCLRGLSRSCISA